MNKNRKWVDLLLNRLCQLSYKQFASLVIRNSSVALWLQIGSHQAEIS
jgi:hypothetical protein